MANTLFLRRAVEDHIRDVLAQRYARPFSAQILRLLPGGSHEFDAVSRDQTIVASVKSASGLTSGGRNPSGKIKDCLAELYFLSLVEAHTRILVLTTPAFFELFNRATVGRVARGLSVECIPLPTELQAGVDRIVRAASAEVSPLAAWSGIRIPPEDSEGRSRSRHTLAGATHALTSK